MGGLRVPHGGPRHKAGVTRCQRFPVTVSAVPGSKTTAEVIDNMHCLPLSFDKVWQNRA
jgi:hypothetical protein